MGVRSILFSLGLAAWSGGAWAGGTDESAKAMEAFARDLQGALSRHEPQRVALLVQFPLRVNTEGARSVQISQSQLLKDFDAVFTPAVVQQVLQQDPSQLFRNYQGAMFGNGAVWADEACKPGQRTACPWRVTSINHMAAIQ